MQGGTKMNKRLIEIIKKISSKEVSFSNLEEIFNVSKRTLRNDIASINEVARSHKMEEIEILPQGKLKVPDNFEDIILKIEDNLYEYKLSKNERIKVVTAMLISENKYITLASIAENLFVSRATIIADLPKVREFIAENELAFNSNNNKGLKIEGSEDKKRATLVKIVENTKNGSKLNFVNVQNYDKTTLAKILIEQERKYQSFLTEGSFERVLSYLRIMIDRNKNGNIIANYEYTKTGKYEMSRELLKCMHQYFEITVTESEILYLNFLLDTSRYSKLTRNDENAVKIQLITRKFINKISDELLVNLNDDFDFYENLSNHLMSVITEKPSEYQENEIIKKLIEENIEIYNLVNANIEILNKHILRRITKIEIEYVTVHICAALERKRNSEVDLKIIVACNSGYGTSRLLLETLKKHFSFTLVDVISSHEVDKIDDTAADLIISTVKIDIHNIEHIVVSAVLTDSDFIRLGNKIDVIRKTKRQYGKSSIVISKNTLKKIQDVLDEEVPEKSNEIMRKIKKVINNYDSNSEVNSDLSTPYLHHMLPKSHIKIDVLCKTWEESIEKAAQILLKEGYIENSYIQAMIESVRVNGPYIVITKGFAVPHAKIEDGSLKFGMSLIRLKTPVEFGAGANDPVEFVCCLSTIDHKTHLKAFFNLVNLLQNEEFKERLRKSETEEDIAKNIERYEHSL